MIWLWLMAWAGEPFADVRRPLEDGAWVNWTRLEVEVEASAFDPLLKVDSKPLEQAAITEVDGRIGSVCALVPLAPGVRLGDVRDRIIQEARGAWRLDEGRYYASGRVEVRGVVDLQPMAAPWMASRAANAPEVPVKGPTGVVVDLRGIPVTPTYAPEIVDPNGEIVYGGTVWRDAAFLRAPVVWVSDPAHPQAQRAGAEPAFFIAAGALGAKVVLSAADAARFRAEVSPTRASGEGAVVLVVDP
jgi:hypothetical protein